MTMEISGIACQYNTVIVPTNTGSIDVDDIIGQCVYCAHPRFVERDTVVFYDAHGYEVDGYNDDDIQGTTIILRSPLNQNQI
jgi:hypothetical protein